MIERRIHAEVIEGSVELELGELCRICGLSREIVVEWVDEGVIEPSRRRRQWHFSGSDLKRAYLARRLQRDLELETRTLPVVLDLIEELETLREENRVLRRMIE